MTYNDRGGASPSSGQSRQQGAPPTQRPLAPGHTNALQSARQRLPALNWRQGKGRCIIYGCHTPTTTTWCDDHGGEGKAR